MCSHQTNDGDQVPCEFKNLHSNSNATRMICKNIKAKLASQKGFAKYSLAESDLEHISSYDRKLAYFIRFHLRDILTSDHRHVWFNIQTKSLDDIEDRTQMFRKPTEDIQVVYSFGSMLAYDTFISHTDDRTLARISFAKFGKAIKLETTTHCLTMPFRSLDAQILVNHSTNDNSVQIIFMLKAPPIIEQHKGKANRDTAQLIKEIPLCSELFLRFYPSSTAWSFLRQLPIAGYSPRASDDLFHINFAIFCKKNPSNLPPMSMPTNDSPRNSYGIEMLWSLGHVFQDKYKDNPQFLLSIITTQTNFYNLCCAIWQNLKANHCYQIEDALQTSQHREIPSESTSIKEVAYAILTPHRIEYQPMPMKLSHRGFDLYPPEDWLLVHIRDNNGIDKIHKQDLQTQVYFRNLMLKGITRGKRSFRYFGSSGSQLNQQAGWFLSLPDGENMDSARERIGDLSKIRNVSNYIARVGQYLTTSRSTEIKLTFIDEQTAAKRKQSSIFSGFSKRIRRLFFGATQEKIEYTATIIPDIERNDFCFTDGCGKISLGLAKKIAINIGIRVTANSDIPSAFQVRIAGCKGMLAIDPESKLNQYYIEVRKSMVKFDSDDWTLHIVDHSRPMPLSLNNQVIRLLSDLGVSNGVFESIQTRCFDRKEFWHPPSSSYLNAIDTLDQSVISEKRQQYRNAKFFLQKNKIPLPVNEARCLFGIADETKTLKPGECFIQCRDLQSFPGSKEYFPVEGTVIVTKMPCLHPGDVRKLKAVPSPALEACIRDCIVFSIQGYRPNCHEMAGSDLDGDQYWVYWGNEFEIPTLVDPLLYPSAKKAVVDRVTNELIVDNVLETFTNRIPGIIANTHKVIADKHDLHTRSKEAKECAKLFARAIDSRKTGEIINLNLINQYKSLYCQTYPGWMMKFDKPLMDPPSKSINEILYRKALHAWIHPDNDEDVIRPLPDAEFPTESVTLDMNQTLEEESERKDEYRLPTICIIIMWIILAVIVVYVILNVVVPEFLSPKGHADPFRG